jgi:acid phosphatase family membrane protein YuiD
MHDAAGLRAAAGRQAGVLNQVAARLYEGRKAKPLRLKEQLGHSVPEVLSGALLGMIVAFLLYPGN